IIVEAPWWKTKSFEVRFEDAAMEDKYFSKFLGDGLRYELSDFVSMINGFAGKNHKLTTKESVWLAEIMEKFLAERRQQQLLKKI
ncbi:MAG: glycerol-3-phosphate cytidylyltransferase, partial [Lachnospiraceae bacterium]|nr:glycerol-3-phosphate cytidylyltransferase [Lachnospiraceae bacterium]